MSDNVSAKKTLEKKEKAKRAEEERKERIKAQKLRGVDTSDGKKKNRIDCIFNIFSS